ncbi:MAG: hypothetical protein ACR2IP_06640 [Solirubrobacteraceae bacterium]
MSRPVRVLLLTGATIAAAASFAACGTERITVPKSDPAHAGAVLFSQRCAGCHTLSFAATHGSSPNPRSPQFNNGPNFDLRCERPLTRVLYAIENGGFEGSVMPQDVVVGQDAVEVAQFVSKYAGRQAMKIPGLAPCSSTPVGAVPPVAPTPTPASTPTKAASSTTAKTPKPAAARKPSAKPHGAAAGHSSKQAKPAAASAKQKAKPAAGNAKKKQAAHP